MIPRVLIGLAVVALIVVIAFAWAMNAFNRPGPLTAETSVVIEPGAGLATVTKRLMNAGVITDPLLFRVGVRILGDARGLRAGEYAFGPGASMRSVVASLAAGRTIDRRLTIPEGLTSAAIVELIAAAPALSGTLDAIPEEGTLLPETYHYTYGDSRAELVARMQEAMTRTLAELWPQRQAGLPLVSAQQAVILASIVEKETGIGAERPRVAAVFINRLKRGMPLQADPTIAYGLALEGAAPGRPLTRADLARRSPYNTYLRRGLPPGPIANPGRASLEAVLDPADTDELFFVADGSGGHAFARTLEEHNRNVAKWRRRQATQPAP
jgi:UPF0755 protein